MVLLGTNVTAAIELWCFLLCVVCFCIISSAGENDRFLKCQKHIVVCNGVILLSDSISAIYTGQEGQYLSIVIFVCNTIAFAFAFWFIYWAGIYIMENLPEEKSTTVRRETIVIVIVGMIVVFQNIFTHNLFYVDDANNYCRGTYFWLSQVVAAAAICHYLYLVLKYRKVLSKRRAFSFIFFIIITLASALLQLAGVPLTLTYAAMTLGMFMIIMNSFLELITVMMEKERRVSEANLNIVKSQIRPHFLYNCLNSIYYLCDNDPNQAKEAISDFSEYLRTDLDSLSGDRIIPFKKELEHVERYLRLEKMRFEDKLNVVYEIEFYDFKMPSLTLQPLVENAVKHGISKKPGGGTILISSRKVGNNVVVSVEDDGVGFDKEAVKAAIANRDDNSRTHIGADNVEKRIRDLAFGELTIDSKPGEGTKALVVLPIRDLD